MAANNMLSQKSPVLGVFRGVGRRGLKGLLPPPPHQKKRERGERKRERKKKEKRGFKTKRKLNQSFQEHVVIGLGQPLDPQQPPDL